MPRGDGEDTSKEWGNGFSPDVCEGCPHHEFHEKNSDGGDSIIERVGNAITQGKDGYWRCGICKCPTGENKTLDITNAPPAGCPYLVEHAEASAGDGDAAWE